MATKKSIEKLPLVVITGPTASGKTSLAIKLAKMYDGEIICADSRTIYKYMDIGTAKPTVEERGGVVHWGLDLVEPGDHFSAADFKSYTVRKIAEIRARGNVPFLVGGTGLYIDSVVFDFEFGEPVDDVLRETLQAMSLEALWEYCNKNNITLPENKFNKRYVIRTIERGNSNMKRSKQLIDDTLIVGITTDKEILRQRINDRAEQLFDDGVVKEATLLGKKYGWENEAMTASIYKLIHLYLSGRLTTTQLREKFTTADWRLAKRQITWLKRNPSINWLSLDDAEHYISERLANVLKS